MAAVFGEYSWQEAFYSVEALFEIESLFPEQKEAIKAFIEKDVSINRCIICIYYRTRNLALMHRRYLVPPFPPTSVCDAGYLT